MSTTEYYQREVSDSEDEFAVQRSRKTSNTVFPDSEDEQVSKSKKSKTAKKTALKKRKPAEEELTDSEDEQLNKRKKSKTAKKTAPKKRKPAEEELTDSEDEQLNKRASKAAKKRPATNKQKPSTSVEKRAPTSGWKLELDDDEEIESCRAPPARLQSVLTRRVADGNLRRTASLPGDLFIDLRVYNTKDIRSVAPKDRWEKSLLSLKYQTDSDADGVDQLRQFIKLARADFVEEGTFFADKKK